MGSTGVGRLVQMMSVCEGQCLTGHKVIEEN